MRVFRNARRQAMRENWRDVATLSGLIVAAAIWVSLADGLSQVLAAFVLGAGVTAFFFGWVMGFNARLLRWRWGAWGEEWTAEELKKLGEEWRVFHDLEDGSGNLDHVVVGPGGVFLVDTKNVSQPARADESGLRAGRVYYSAARARGAAARLHDRIQERTGSAVWVQSMFAVWGDFPAGVDEHDRVLYVSARRLTETLTSRPRRLSDAEIQQVADAVQALASSAA
jgi:hypothetical protein